MEDILVSMNRGKERLSKKKPQLRMRNWWGIGVIALVVLCVTAIGLMAFLNRQPFGSRYTYTTASDIWYLEESGMEIAAPQAAD